MSCLVVEERTVNLLLLDGQVGGDGIWWVDGLVRLSGVPASVLQDDPRTTRVL